MKNIAKLTLAALFALPFAVKAQDCKFDIKEKDKFSGKSKVGYWYQLGTEMIVMEKVDGKTTFEITSNSTGAMKQGVEKGAIGQIRLANGEMISFTASENAEPVVKVNGAGTNVNSSIKVKYDITPEDLSKMGASAPVALKAMLGSKEVVKEFADKKAEKMRAAAKCLSDYKD